MAGVAPSRSVFFQPTARRCATGPASSMPPGYTIQLLNAAARERAGIDVVADLRSRDVAAGQGAAGPGVVPSRDVRPGWARRSRCSTRRHRQPDRPARMARRWVSTVAANALLDEWAQAASRHAPRRGRPLAGRRAARARRPVAVDAGRVHLAKAPPKSTGRDLKPRAWLAAQLARCPTRHRRMSRRPWPSARASADAFIPHSCGWRSFAAAAPPTTTTEVRPPLITRRRAADRHLQAAQAAAAFAPAGQDARRSVRAGSGRLARPGSACSARCIRPGFEDAAAEGRYPDDGEARGRGGRRRGEAQRRSPTRAWASGGDGVRAADGASFLREASGPADLWLARDQDPGRRRPHRVNLRYQRLGCPATRPAQHDRRLPSWPTAWCGARPGCC